MNGASLNKIHVACTALGGRLVIARMGKDPCVSLDQRECEPEFMRALVDYMTHDAPKGSVKAFSLNGKSYELTLRVKERSQ